MLVVENESAFFLIFMKLREGVSCHPFFDNANRRVCVFVVAGLTCGTDCRLITNYSSCS